MLVQNEARMKNAVAGDFKAAPFAAAEPSRLSRDNFVRALEMEKVRNRRKKLPSPCNMEIMTTRVDLNQHRCDFWDMMREIEREHLFDTVSIAIVELENVTPNVKGSLPSDLKVCVRIPENITNPCFSIKNMFFN